MATSAVQLDPNEMRNLAISLGSNAPPPSVAAPISMPSPQAAPDLGISTSAPHINAPRGTIAGDTAERGRLLSTGAGEDQIYGKIANSNFGQQHPTISKILGGLGEGIAKAGDIGLSAVAPALAINLPGTEYHHQAQLNQVNRQIGTETKEGEQQAQTANLESEPALHQAQLENAQNKASETEQHHEAQIAEQLHAHGFDQDEKGNIVPLPYEKMSEGQQATQDLKAAQEERAEAQTALDKAKNDPNSPAFRLAQQRLAHADQIANTARQRLSLSQQQFELRSQGTVNGAPAEGSMISDSGKSVGTAFQQNVRPTGTERNKGDLATSAGTEIDHMKAIVQKHPDFFGPGYGQSSAFKQWIGSEDPDAQKFLAARTIAGDHLAGTFGGRSEAALAALDKALGQFKDNPRAALAGLDELSGANATFKKAGTVRTTGSNAAKGEVLPPSSGKGVNLKDAMALPANKGKSEADVRKDIEAHGHKVVE